MAPPSPTLTAIGVAALRALYSEMPAPLAIVHDPFAARLLPPPLGALTRLLHDRPALGRLVHRSLRAVTRDLSISTPLRTVAIDNAVRSALEQGARQLVVLGSGLDSRAWRCPELERIDVFEVDREKTHRYKRKRLAHRTPLAQRHHYVEVDFARHDLASRLKHAGFEPERPAVWIWEGVIVYLPHQAIASTVQKVSQLSAPGSTLVGTYTCPGLGTVLPTAHLRWAARLIGEPLRGLISTSQLHQLLESADLQPTVDEPVTRWAALTLPRSEATSGPDWERLIVAVRR